MADRNSVLIGIGIGCIAVILGLMAMAGACSFWVYRQAEQIQRDVEDPGARRSRVLEILGTDSLPEGYHPVAAFSVPFLLRTAVLGDREVPEGEEQRGQPFDERGFIFVETLGVGQDEQQLRDYFEGRTDDPSVLEENGFNMDVDEVLSRGTLPPDGDVRFLYMAQRAAVALQGFRGRGLSALVLVDCPDDERRRMGIWFGPDPESGDDGAADLAGTPADPEAISGFLANFSFCG